MNEWEWQLLEDKTVVDHIVIAGAEVRTGDRVRLFPHKGSDILDIALHGQIATIESIEQDYEGKSHVCVVLDDDPGRDLGLLRQPGHRFFFDAEEVEPLGGELDSVVGRSGAPRILIAGIGNIFLGDDGFGVEVAQALAKCSFSGSVRVTDFGLRGFDLVYALLNSWEAVVLVDALPRGDVPGTLYVIEPNLAQLGDPALVEAALNPHGMDPARVLSLAASMGPISAPVFVVGCEPLDFGDELEGRMGLSEVVQASVEAACDMVEQLVERIRSQQAV